MNQYKVKISQTPKHYIVEELGDDQSSGYGPPKKFPVHDWTAEQILDRMFKDEGSHFFSEKVPSSELPKTSRAPQRKP